jgi:large subunit ribosomal protein L15
MQIHELKSKTERIKPQKVGRGGKRGKTSGRGTKGQKARSGHRMYPEIRDMIKKIPKLRGRGKNINKAFALANASVTLLALENNFKAGERVTPQSLFDKGLIKKINGKFPPVKILAKGEITKKITIKSCLVSATVKSAIEKAGGTIM